MNMESASRNKLFDEVPDSDNQEAFEREEDQNFLALSDLIDIGALKLVLDKFNDVAGMGCTVVDAHEDIIIEVGD